MVQRSRDAEAELNLPPGFRFHPTDEELVQHYLCRKAAQQFLPVPIIAEVDLYKYDPWQLPEKALFGKREWYFFTPRDRKYPNGSRPNRAAGSGYWKATGADKPVTPSGSSRPLGIKKALVFYAGKAPRGTKTNWIMHEYRLADTNRAAHAKGSLRLDDWVLCRLYNKKGNWESELKKLHKAEVSFSETMSDGHRSPESVVVDNDGYPEFPAAAGGIRTGESVVKEDHDWFMDLNLEDLHNSFAPIEAAAAALDMGSYQDFYFPPRSSNQPSLPPVPYEKFP